MAAAAACISEDSPVLDGAKGCEEFAPGEPIDDDLQVGAEVRAFMQAAADLTGVAVDMGDEVLAACAGIALDLGAEDTWSELATLDAKISNTDGTGACDAATARITDALAEAGEVDARVALAVTRGECHIDFDAQAECDARCAEQASCEPGTVETRCEPGELSVVCDASCEVGAHCVGTPELPANCMGQCEAECVGACEGTCIAADGTRTENDPACAGKCTASCHGSCRGRCEIEQPGGIECGAEVRCEGGCTGTFSDPVCTSDYTPPACEIDPECHATCTAEAIANATCEPTRVEVFADIATTPALEPLVAALEEHLPPLFDAAEARGPLAQDALRRLGDTGDVIAEELGELEGKELACVGAAARSVLTAVSIFDVAVDASVDVTVTTTEQCD